MNPIATQSAPIGGAFALTGLDLSGMQRIVVLLDGLAPTTDGDEIRFQLTSGGVPIGAGYRWKVRELSTSGSTNDSNDISDPSVRLCGAAGDWGVGNGATKSYSGQVDLGLPAGRWPVLRWQGTSIGRTGNSFPIDGGGHLESTATIDGVAVSAPGGLSAGSVTVYGVPLGPEAGSAIPAALTAMWVGALVAITLTADATVRLAVDTDPLFTAPTYSASVATSAKRARLGIPTLSPGDYYAAVEVNGTLDPMVGRFRVRCCADTLVVAFAGDAVSGSNATVFDAIRGEDADWFLHLGDMHYEDIGTNDVARYHAAYDAVFSQSRQAQLYRSQRVAYIYDDHDFGPDDSYGGSAGRNAAVQAYRSRVPSIPALTGVTDPVYHAWDENVAGLSVRFIVTDQRSMASNKTATDNASKSVLGTAQKDWWKDQVATAPGLVVWVCSRTWGGVPTAGVDHWGGFTTERAELVAWINANAPGRVVVLSADMHSLAIDDGTHHWGLPTFQAAPLDKTDAQAYGGATYTYGRYTNNHQYGLMTVAKTGPGELTVTWTGKRDTGAILATHTVVVPV